MNDDRADLVVVDARRAYRAAAARADALAERCADLQAQLDAARGADTERRVAVAQLCGGLTKVARTLRRGERATLDERLAAVRILRETMTGIEQLRANAGVAERALDKARRHKTAAEQEVRELRRAAAAARAQVRTDHESDLAVDDYRQEDT